MDLPPHGGADGKVFRRASIVTSCVRRRNQTLNEFDIYSQAFIWPNGFHLNGNYHRHSFSGHKNQVFTMEAECTFTAAVNRILLQSWGGRIRIFHPVPDAWKEVSLKEIRAQGGILILGAYAEGRNHFRIYCLV